MTYENGDLKMYHDGVEVFSASGLAFLPNVPTDGKYHVGSGRGKGAFDQVEIYKDLVLSEEQIQSLAAKILKKIQLMIQQLQII